VHTPQTPEERARHWDSAYAAGGGSVSWYQNVPHVSVGLIESLGVPHDAPVLDVGGGASTLADQLVARGFADVSVLDVSAAALDEGRRRLGEAAPVHWLHEDILVWEPERRYGLWHDRALLHFLVDSDDRAQYMKTLRSALRDEGFVLLSTFATDGPEVCSGLPVIRYSVRDLEQMLGLGFRVIETRREEHVTPRGVTQPFVWVAAQIDR
jgi:SAM-dependent methyltransferase